MTVEFTPEQRDAIERRGSSLLVRAGAGTGKTSVLVERFVRGVIEDGAAVEAVLAITFTEKAADELKTRVRARFLELGRRDEARATEAAWISTIHGFCSRVLRAHALAAGIDPDYRVLDELAAERLSLDAFDRTLEEFLPPEAEPRRLEMVAAYTPEGLRDMVLTAYSRLRSRGERRPRLPEVEPPEPAGERRWLETAARAALGELDPSTGGTQVARALERLERCRELLARLPAREPAEPAEVGELELKGSARALTTSACEEYERARAAYASWCLRHRRFLDHTLLRELLALYGERYERLKGRRSGLDYQDLELLARDLLRGDLALRDQYAGRFRYVMVDEFQDVNPLQNEILGLLERDNLFRVGDERQSIYGFRNADVGVFREHHAAAAAGRRLASLTVNFRGRGELLDAVDMAFDRVWDDFEPLREGPEARAKPPRTSPCVDLIVTDKRKGAWNGLPDGFFGPTMRSVPAWRACEARLLARRIHELTGEGGYRYREVVLLLRATTHMRAYERALEERGIPTHLVGGRGYWSQQQVADLRAWLGALANPLDELALYSVLASPLVGASLDALALVGLTAHRRGRDVWWALREAFGGGGEVATDGAAEIESGGGDDLAPGRGGDLPPGGDGDLAPGGPGDLAGALGEEDRARIEGFVRRFSAERRAAPRLSLETLIDRAVTASGYDRHVLALPAGERRMANVRKLMRLAREFEAEHGRDLRAFIDFVAERDVIEERQGEAPLEAEQLDAVQIMTVHRAKGLEFPVVCLGDLGKGGREDSGALRISEDGRLGLRLAQFGGGAIDDAELGRIKEAQRIADEAEEKRIFYVAITRAMEHLVLSGATDLGRRPHEEPLKEPMRWVWRAFCPSLPTGGAAGQAADEYEGRPVSVHWTTATSETVDELLGEAGRSPNRREPGRAAPAATPPLELGAPPAPPALPVSRLSYTGLEDYKRCGYRFYLERALRFPSLGGDPLEPGEELSASPLRRAISSSSSPEPAPADGPGREPRAGDELPALLRGTIVHELLEGIDLRRSRAPGPEEVAARIEAHGASAREPDVAELRSLVEGLLAAPLRRRLAAARRVRTEVPFAFTLPLDGPGGRSLLVNGVVDVYAHEGDGTLIVDYKSDRLEGLEPTVLWEEKYATQRLVYALAALRAGAERVEVAHLFLERPAEPVAATFEAAQQRRLERELRSLAGAVVAGRFEPTDAPHRELCSDCPGQPALCSWGPERTLAEG